MALAPNPEENLTLGKGIFYFNKKNQETGLYEGYRDLGNAPEVNSNITPDKLPHFSSREGKKTKDNEVIKELALKFNFTLDEPNSDNLALTFMADEADVTQTSATGETEDIIGVKQGRYYSVGKRNITVTGIALKDTPATTYDVTDDYTVDTTYGRIYIVPGGAITDTTDITVTFNVAETEYKQIKTLQQDKVEGMLHFISDNPAGANFDIEIWRASLIPTGNIGFITDDWMTLSFEAEVLKDASGHPDSPFMNIIYM